MTSGEPVDGSRPALPAPQWDEAVALLGAGGSVVLACHVGPDGDALGSMLALGLALRRRGADVVCSWGDPRVRVPPSLSFLPGQDLLRDVADLPQAPDVMVTLDTGSIDRLGALAPLVARAGAVLVVDHHASNTLFGTHHVVDTAAAATAVLVCELVDRLGVPLDADIAAGIYTGLVTDTGSFKFRATTPAVHRLAARLLETGVRHDVIARALWDTTSFRYLGLLGTVLRRARLEPEAVGGLGLVWTYASVADLEEHQVNAADVEGVIDVIRTAAEAEVALVCKSDPTGGIKVSLRSKGRLDVGAVCVELGGGGHRFAAGFTSYDDVEATVAIVRARLASAEHLAP